MALLPSQLEVKTAYQNAPVYLQEFIGSDQMYDVFQDMVKVHKLHIDQAGSLALAINSIILGLRPLEQFPSLLKEALNDTSDVLNKAISEEANSKVFSALRGLTKRETTPPKPAAPLQTAPAAVGFAPTTPSQIQQIQKPANVVPPPAPAVAAAPVVPAPAKPMTTQLPPIPQPMPVAETKMATTSAPAPMTTEVPMPATTAIPPAVPKIPKPDAPVKYHGTDPYREPFE